MNQLISLLTLIGALICGMLLGRIRALDAFKRSPAFTALRNTVLYALIFVMGFHLGRTEEILNDIPSLGLAAVIFAAATVGGTSLVLAALFALLPRPSAEAAPRSSARGADAPPAPSRGAALRALADPLILLSILTAGFLVAFLIPVFPGADAGALITVILYILLAAVGLGLSGSGIRFTEIITHPNLILIPLGTAVGSLLGGLGAGLLLGMRPGTALAVSSGFGWYSLSGVMLTGLDGPVTGSIAFLANIARESAALLLIPLLARTRFPYIAIGAGGATAMDVTLPLIEKNCGPRAVGFAMASGGILSLLVPILVPLFYNLGL